MCCSWDRRGDLLSEALPQCPLALARDLDRLLVDEAMAGSRDLRGHTLRAQDLPAQGAGGGRRVGGGRLGNAKGQHLGEERVAGLGPERHHPHANDR